MHMMSPISFIRNPMLWIDLISRHSIKWSLAPDFAFRLVARKFIEARDRNGGHNPLPGLDLSSLAGIQSAAEPIRIDTKDMFGDVFIEFGLRKDYLSPAYGLAEHVVGVCYTNEYHLSTSQGDGLKPLVAVGRRSTLQPWATDVKIVCPETRCEMEDGKTGELWISGPCVAAGYFGKPELSQDVFCAQMVGSNSAFLRTGDRAFIEDDFLFICGRSKDLIIVNGVNYYPQDIEQVVEDASIAVRPGCVAVFSADETDHDGDICILFEIRNAHSAAAMTVCQQVRTAVLSKIGLLPSRVVAIREKTIPKTTSGKIRRRASRTLMNNESEILPLTVAELEIRKDRAKVSGDFSRDADDMDGCQPSQSNLGGFDGILCNVLGSDHIDLNLTWDEIGLSSMVSVELVDAIANEFALTLSSDCFERFRTPAELKSYIIENQGMPFPIKLPALPSVRSTELSWFETGILQAVGAAILLLLFAASIIPAWYVGKLDFPSKLFAVNGRWVLWRWVPIVIPAFMFSFSVVVIISKWVVIGRYSEGRLRTPSVAYLRWWYIDRAVDLWEFWVGRFVKDTPLLWLFYFLCGARIHPSAQLKVFLREFDLLSIGEGASIEHNLQCRVFEPWKRNMVGPTIRFRQVSIGRNSTVKGLVRPGVQLGEGAFAETLSVVTEGSQVPPGVAASGNPAFNIGPIAHSRMCCSWWKLGIFKLIWLGGELYLFFALFLVGQMTWNERLPIDWRYTPLCYWFLIVLEASILSIIVSIMLKWLLIGKRRPGPCREGLWRSIFDWGADYHFQISLSALNAITENSRAWNLILMLFGMDTDLSSAMFASFIVPSKVDLLCIQRSFVGVMTLDTKAHGAYHRIKIKDESSIGWGAHIGPGVTIAGTRINPLTKVTDDVSHEVDGGSQGLFASHSDLLQHEIKLAFLYLVYLLSIFVSFMPSYELWEFGVKPSSVFLAVPAFAAALAAQTFTALLILCVFQMAAVGCGSTKPSKPCSFALYAVYHTVTYSIQVWSFQSLLWGTPMFSFVLKLLGANVEGHLLYFGFRVYDPAYITFTDRTISDGATIVGHYGLYNKLVLGPCHVSGLIHQQTFAMANTVVTAEESGPGRALVPSGRVELHRADAHDTATAGLKQCTGDRHEHNQTQPPAEAPQ